MFFKVFECFMTLHGMQEHYGRIISLPEELGLFFGKQKAIVNWFETLGDNVEQMDKGGEALNATSIQLKDVDMSSNPMEKHMSSQASGSRQPRRKKKQSHW